MLSYMLPVSEKPPIPPTANLATGGGGGGTTARLQLALGDAATATTPPPPPPTANSNSNNNNNNNSPPMPNGGPAPAARQPQLPTRQQLQQQPPPGVGLVAPPTHQPPLPPHAGGGGSSLPTDSSVSSLSSSEVGTTPSSQSTATPTDARPRNKLQANGKHPTLKRVSFGSSKGSMVETLVYESPLREEPEAISPSPEAASAALLAGPGADPEALAEWLKRFSLSSELRRRRLRVRHPRKSRPPGSARRRPGSKRVRVSFFECQRPVQLPPSDVDAATPLVADAAMAMAVSGPEAAAAVGYQRQASTDSGWDNPFRPDGNLSKEADEIVELIKGGKPITPTSGAAPAPAADAQPAADGAAVVDGASPVSASPQHAAAPGSPTAVAHTVPQQNNAKVGANGNAATAPGGGGGGGGAGGGVADGQKAPATPGNLEVQRGTVDPSQAVEHVVLKKKQKCKCCVIQ